MQKIIDYFNEYPHYAKVLALSLIVIAVLTAAVLILRRAVAKKRNASKPAEFTAEKTKTIIESEAETKAETSEKTTIEQAKKNEPADMPADEPIGEWVIIEQNGKFIARLISSGETLLTSEGYGSLSGLKSGIDTLKNNLQSENYAVNVDKNGGFYFKLFSTANRLLCSSESYSTRERCENAFLKCKRASEKAPIINKQ